MPDLHHHFGPSGLASYEQCPRFEKREQKEGEAHPVAVEGTMLHAKVELRDLTNLNSEQTTMVENALAYMDQHTQGADNVEQEIMLDICKKEDDSYVSFGTTDLIAHYYDKGHAVSIDWKFGWHDVTHPETNLQVWCYVVGLFEKYDYIKTVDAHIYMARHGEAKTFSFNREDDLERMKLRILTVVERVEQKADYSPSTKACLYCAAKGTCPAVANHALSVVDEKMDLAKLTTEITDPAQMSRVLKAVELFEPWCKEVREKAKEMILKGESVHGYDVRERKGAPTMGNPSDIYDAVKDKVTIEEFNSACDVKLTKLKKLVREKAPKGAKGLSEELLVSTLKQKSLIKEPDPSLVLYRRKKI
jgi:hypothetical protein